MVKAPQSEKFPHLSKAPIVEAVFEVRVIPLKAWDEAMLENEIKIQLADYPNLEKTNESKFQIFSQKQTPEIENLGCVGFELVSKDKLQIVQFNKESLVFSRLKPYETWKKFSNEALRLLEIYQNLQQPSDVGRIGIRFVNRISQHHSKELAFYYEIPPVSMKNPDWPLFSYFHHDIVEIPTTPYKANIIKTIQNIGSEKGLVLDIDVYIEEQFKYNKDTIADHMNKMRSVKNKIFFGSITKKCIKELK